MAFLNASCDQALYGWPCDAQIEKLRDDFARAGSVAEQKAIIDAIQAHWVKNPTHIHLGQWYTPAAIRNDVTGYLQGGVPVFWNVEKN